MCIPFFEEPTIWLEHVAARNKYPRAVEPLQAVLKHRPVDLFKHIEPHLNSIIRAHPEDVAVECGVMQLAEREAVRHSRLAIGIAGSNDVSSLEPFLVPAAAASAMVALRG